MLKLENITLVILSSIKIDKSIKALEYSSKDIQWGSVKLISDIKPDNLPDFIHHEFCPKMSNIDEWNYAAIYELPKHIETDYCMLIHDDGFVVNADSWKDEFLDYDYIGAPWPMPQDDFSFRAKDGELVRVGNSVSLRSKKLLDLPIKLNLEWKAFHGYYNEDGYICVNYRHKYLENGIKFANIDIAKYFSHESMIPEIEGITPFAFHRHYGTNSQHPNYGK